MKWWGRWQEAGRKREHVPEHTHTHTQKPNRGLLEVAAFSQLIDLWGRQTESPRGAGTHASLETKQTTPPPPSPVPPPPSSRACLRLKPTKLSPTHKEEAQGGGGRRSRSSQWLCSDTESEGVCITLTGVLYTTCISETPSSTMQSNKLTWDECELQELRDKSAFRSHLQN